MPRYSSILGGFLLLAAACATNGGRREMVGPGIFQETLDGGIRYTLSIPPERHGDNPIPLILALHYGGEVTPFFGAGALKGVFEPAFRELGAIIVAPDCPGRGWTDPRSLDAIWAVLERVSSDFRIDSNRTLVTGYSMGGMGTWYLASNYPERFAAAVVVSGRPPEKVSLDDWRVPLFVIHSRRDEVLELGPTQAAVNQLESQGAEVRLMVLESPTHYQTGRYVSALREALPWVRQIWDR